MENQNENLFPNTGGSDPFTQGTPLPSVNPVPMTNPVPMPGVNPVPMTNPVPMSDQNPMQNPNMAMYQNPMQDPNMAAYQNPMQDPNMAMYQNPTQDPNMAMYQNPMQDPNMAMYQNPMQDPNMMPYQDPNMMQEQVATDTGYEKIYDGVKSLFGEMGVAFRAMIYGILSLLTCCFSRNVTIVLSMLAIIRAIVTLRNHYPGKGFAIAAIVIGGIALFFTLALWALTLT